MLRELRIDDFALVDRLALRFGPGFNVITGETGAGKTVLFEALALLLGRKGARPPVREGAEEAVLQGLFTIKNPSSFPLADLLDEEGSVLVERRIPRSGRGRVEVNGRLVPLDRLRGLGEALVDFHGQQERESLLDPALQRAYLDAYAGAGEALGAYRAAAEALGEARAKRAGEEKRIVAAREKEDFLRWQAEEIDRTGLRPGEEEELAEEARILKQAERIRELVYHVRESLREEDGSAMDRLGEAAERLERYADHGDAPREAAEACRRALAEVEEALLQTDRLAERIDAPAGALDRAMERLESIAALKRKHRSSVEEILAMRERIAADLERIDAGEERLRVLHEEEERLAGEAARAAEALSSLRSGKSEALGAAIETNLQPLALRGARFTVTVERTEDPEGKIGIGGKRFRAGRDGIDRVEFLFAANKGEPLLPLRRVASGGEISRAMLAIKRVLADHARVPTALFDEIDAGVGGDVGERIGEALAEVGARRQVLCITHLPAIAGRADRHLRVEKREAGGRTVIRVEEMEGEARVEEMVRMMGGSARPEVSVPHAKEILNSARKGRRRTR
ncbi:MAG: DNA repair protein RecN [Candidatus Eisenbacteria bacterium]|nr:DNA repair protein RecN [Candidatus Eisenbacteria bacterium]